MESGNDFVASGGKEVKKGGVEKGGRDWNRKA